MPTLKEVRHAVATTLSSAISGLAVYERVPSSVVVPALMVAPSEAMYQFVMGNRGTQWSFDLMVLSGAADSEIAQDVLDDFVDATGSKSIRAAIHAAPQLGRNDVSAAVETMTNYGMRYEIGTTDFLGATLRLKVVASNS